MTDIAEAAFVKAQQAARYPAAPRLTRKHRVLIVNPRRFTSYEWPLAEDMFRAGCLVQVVSIEVFVRDVATLKRDYDVIAMAYTSIGNESPVTAQQAVDALTEAKAAGAKFIICQDTINTVAIRKWNRQGNYAETVSLAPLLDGLTVLSGYNFSSPTGTLQHTPAYPFDVEIVRPGKVVNNWPIYAYQSPDPDTIFPVQAVNGVYTAPCVAYKPGAFWVMSYLGVVGGNTEATAAWNYLYGHHLVNLLMGKESDARVSLDAQYGRRIAAFGIDADVTTDTDAVDALVAAVGKQRQVEYGLRAKEVTPALAGYYRGLGVPLCSHTYSHYNDRITVTDETHVIPADQVVRLKRPFRPEITSIKTTDDTTTFSRVGNDFWQGNPSAGQYSATVDTNAAPKLFDGNLKFSSADVGKSVKVTYTCDDEHLETLGSLDALREAGALTDQGIYLTQGYGSVHGTTRQLADREGVGLCDYVSFPNHSRAWMFARDYNPPTTYAAGVLAQAKYGEAIIDSQLMQRYDKATAKATVEDAIERCAAMELPFVFYGHDFPLSLTYPAGVWLSASYNADWKKATQEDTVAYVQEFYTWLMEALDDENVVWWTRSAYSRFYDYANRHLAYDVEVQGGRTLLSVVNRGGRDLPGLTVRESRASAPKRVRLLGEQDVEHTFEGGTVTAWFDLPAGASVTLEVS